MMSMVKMDDEEAGSEVEDDDDGGREIWQKSMQIIF